MKKLFISVAAAFAMLVAPMIASAQIAGPQISIPVNTVVRIPENDTKELGSESVSDDLRGMVCDVVAVAENQSSVHPGNDLIVASGDSSVRLENVERESNGTTEANGQLTLAESVTVTLAMGEDAVFSGGIDVELTCEEPMTEVCRDGQVIEVKESEVLETDTEAPCPVLVEVCRDGEVIEVEESEVLETDTEAPCPELVEVCRDGEVVTIEESEVLGTDTEAPCPGQTVVCRDGEVITVSEDEVLETDTEAPCPEVLGEVTELPRTGPGAIIAAATGIVGIGASTNAFFNSKQQLRNSLRK